MCGGGVWKKMHPIFSMSYTIPFKHIIKYVSRVMLLLPNDQLGVSQEDIGILGLADKTQRGLLEWTLQRNRGLEMECGECSRSDWELRLRKKLQYLGMDSDNANNNNQCTIPTETLGFCGP
ncbi:hypothetical protein M9H77_12815 [Catharanthus roseus]|uniref:Uncharacterized protein n=1 Tax=Catharanthus roseus TaxID=4058 RepID=A0ACC0BIF7_CATRO|nr:hypothetical protein M9H77_12815 [Catharanthus roseus]